MEVGLIHPPVGMNLFVVQAQAPDIKTMTIYRGIVPFLVAPFVLIVLLFSSPISHCGYLEYFMGGKDGTSEFRGRGAASD